MKWIVIFGGIRGACAVPVYQNIEDEEEAISVAKQNPILTPSDCFVAAIQVARIAK